MRFNSIKMSRLDLKPLCFQKSQKEIFSIFFLARYQGAEFYCNITSFLVLAFKNCVCWDKPEPAIAWLAGSYRAVLENDATGLKTIQAKKILI